MYPRDLQLVQSPALSFRTHSRTTTSQRHLGHFWSTDGSLIGFLRGVVFQSIEPLVHRSPRLGITSHFFWTMAPTLGADWMRVVY
jgi:hypothetical protein